MEQLSLFLWRFGPLAQSAEGRPDPRLPRNFKLGNLIILPVLPAKCQVNSAYCDIKLPIIPAGLNARDERLRARLIAFVRFRPKGAAGHLQNARIEGAFRSKCQSQPVKKVV
jgi:hypothetical protein